MSKYLIFSEVTMLSFLYQARGCTLVASSPETLARVKKVRGMM